jgi:hypothetical protein
MQTHFEGLKAIRDSSASADRRLDAFDDDRRGNAAGGAHGDEAALEVAALALIQHRADQHRARGPDRMAQRAGAAEIGVALVDRLAEGRAVGEDRYVIDRIERGFQPGEAFGGRPWARDLLVVEADAAVLVVDGDQARSKSAPLPIPRGVRTASMM